jgi:hypothetical protein
MAFSDERRRGGMVGERLGERFLRRFFAHLSGEKQADEPKPKKHKRYDPASSTPRRTA